MARRPPSPTVSSPPESSTDFEPLIDVLGRLTDELSGIRMVLDNVRDDLSYLIRNGIPHQPIEHVLVKRMALDPTSDDWGSHLELEFSSHVPRNTPLPDRLVDLVESFQASVEAIGQGQLEVLLSVLDGVRGDILDSLRKHAKTSATVSPVVTSPLSARGVLPDSAPLPPPAGRLF